MAYINGKEILFSAQVNRDTTEKPFINTAEMRNFTPFFRGNARLDVLDKRDFSNAYFFSYAFQDSTNLTEEPLIITHKNNIDSFLSVFQNTRIKKFAKNDFSHLGNCSNCFSGNPSLEEVNIYMNGYQHVGLFLNDTALKKVATINMAKSANAYRMFEGCTNLTEITLLNIPISLQIGSGDTWGHLLTVDSLINTVKELVNKGTAKTLTMGSVNKAKIADVWCVVTDDTTDKMSIEIVEAGTEGAMLLEDFARLKNWSIT